MTKRFSGQTIRRYDEHAEHSRRLLFAKDREIGRERGRASLALSTLEYIAAVADGRVGGHDPEWQVAAIGEALTDRVREMIAKRAERAPATEGGED